MPSHREIEIKLRVRDPARVKRRVQQLGFRRVAPRALEVNVLFDFPDRRLVQSGCALRLRTVGGKCFLTFKGAPGGSPRYKSREEIELQASNPGALRRILQRLGLIPVFTYRKHRAVYRPVRSTLGRQILYDETPAGEFLELEGPPRWIDRTARALGYEPEDYITASYVMLYTSGRKTGQRRASVRHRA